MRRRGRGNRYKVYSHQLKRFKRAGKQHHLKSQPIPPKASQTEWRQRFDFPTGISGFPM